ncbi:hypothetical protein ACFY8P_35975 [Streptomyces sp. NPDC012693]|uniref:hypothetical protein n=1 Tax=Streptomyces sp. NPDC012693 TaxID=3364844 RepID=UPI0036CBDC37
MKRRRYTADEINATELRPLSDGVWDVVLVDESIGRVQHRYSGGGRRQGWEATTPNLIRVSHSGEGTYAKTRQAALVDLMLSLGISTA